MAIYATASYDLSRRELTVSVDLGGRSGTVQVIGWHDGGGVLWEGGMSGSGTITLRADPLYLQKGLTVELGYYKYAPTLGEEVWWTVDSVDVPPEQIAGLQDYFLLRGRYLSEARWKYELKFTYPRESLGGFIAVFNAWYDESRKQYVVDVVADGTTRYGDVYTVWFGTSSGVWCQTPADMVRRAVAVDFSGHWGEDLHIMYMDYAKTTLRDVITVKFSEMAPAPAPPTTEYSVVRVDLTADKTSAEAGELVTFFIDVVLDRSLASDEEPNITHFSMVTDTTSEAVTPTLVERRDPVWRYSYPKAFDRPGRYVVKFGIIYDPHARKRSG